MPVTDIGKTSGTITKTNRQRINRQETPTLSFCINVNYSYGAIQCRIQKILSNFGLFRYNRKWMSTFKLNGTSCIFLDFLLNPMFTLVNTTCALRQTKPKFF